MTDLILNPDAARAALAKRAGRVRRNLDQLADNLADIEAKIAHHARRSIEYYAKSGELLYAAKLKVGHGAWLPFLQRVGISQPSAHRRIRLAEYFEALPDKDQHGEAWTLVSANRAIEAMVAQDVSFDDLADDIDAQPPAKAKRKAGKASEAARIRQRAARFIADAKVAVLLDRDVLVVLAELRAQLGELLDAESDD